MARICMGSVSSVRNRRKTNEEFIMDAKSVHGNRYLYGKVDYKTAHTNIIITCRVHGDFTVKPMNHLNGNNCAKCAKITRSRSITKSTEETIDKFKAIHGDRYIYDSFVYKRNNVKSVVTCGIHGDYKISPNEHLSGRGCKQCYLDYRANGYTKYNSEKYIEKAISRNGYRYTYDRLSYAGCRNDVVVTCSKHGDFKVKAYYHLNGNGCQKCSMSKGEYIISSTLDNLGLHYEYSSNIGCIGDKGVPLTYDFYLPYYATAIEFDGIQHFEQIDFFNRGDGVSSLEDNMRRDFIKTRFCIDNGIELIRIPYYDLNSIDEYLIHL